MSKKETPPYYPTVVITNGWFKPLESHLSLGFEFHPAGTYKPLSLSNNFEQYPQCKATAEERATYEALRKDEREKYATREIKSMEWVNSALKSRKEYEQSQEAHNEAIEKLRVFLNALNDRDARGKDIAVFNSHIGRIGLRLSFDQAARLYPLSMQGRLITLTYNDAGQLLSAKTEKPREITTPKPRLVFGGQNGR